MSEPECVLAESRRLLVPGGHLFVTTPFVWPLHEEPYDYYRYTSHALRFLCEQAGFTVERLEPRTGTFATLGIVLQEARPLIPWPTGSVAGRLLSRPLMAMVRRGYPIMLNILARIDRYDRQRLLPLGYLLHARASRAAGDERG